MIVSSRCVATSSRRSEISSVDVAEVGPGEVERLGRLIREAWDEAGPGAPGWSGADDATIAEISTSEALLSRIGGPQHRMFMATADGRPVGFAATRLMEGRSIELSGIIVLQSMLGGGIGTQLLEAAVAQAVEEGCLRIEVHTEVDNAAAIGFYRTHGFDEVGETTVSFDGERVPLVVLERHLVESRDPA